MKTLRKTLFVLSALALIPAMMSCRSETNGTAEPDSGASVMQKDTFKTASGPLTITFIGHGTLMLTFGGKVWHVDPWTNLADYAALPKADVILITHDHGDHLDPKAIDAIRQPHTQLFAAPSCQDKIAGAVILKTGEKTKHDTVEIEAIPAYNIQNKRPDGRPFHPEGAGIGYLLTFAKTRVYIAGDTENTPEMKALKDIDIAFLPMNLPYTMTPEMVADAAKAFRPKILYPYHYGQTDVTQLAVLLKDEKDIDLRIRKLE